MKWFSVRKYTPMNRTDYLVSYRCDNGKQHTTICRYDGQDWVNHWTDVELEEEFRVTHFALIEPVEIEE